MRQRLLPALLWLLWLLWLAIPALAGPGPGGQDEVLGRLRAEASGVEAILADFVQEKHLAMFKETLVSKGRFAFRRPGDLRWEYLEPVRSGFLVSGDKGRRWSDLAGDTREFDVRSDPVMRIVVAQLLAWTSFDLDRLRRQYDIEVLGREPVILKLVPTSTSRLDTLDHLRISFAPDGKSIASVEVLDKDGDFTRIVFSGTVINAPLPEGLF